MTVIKTIQNFSPFSSSIINSHTVRQDALVDVGPVSQDGTTVYVGGYKIIKDGLILEETERVDVTVSADDMFICVTGVSADAATNPTVVASEIEQGIVLLSRRSGTKWVSSSIESKVVQDDFHFERTTDFTALIGPGVINGIEVKDTMEVDLDQASGNALVDYQLRIRNNRLQVAATQPEETQPDPGLVYDFYKWATCYISDIDGNERADGLFAANRQLAVDTVDIYEGGSSLISETIVNAGDVDYIAIGQGCINGDDATLAICHDSGTLDIYGYNVATNTATLIAQRMLTDAVSQLIVVNGRNAIAYALTTGTTAVAELVVNGGAGLAYLFSDLQATTDDWIDVDERQDGYNVLTFNETSGNVYVDGTLIGAGTTTSKFFLCNGNIAEVEADTTFGFMGSELIQRESGSRTFNYWRKVMLPDDTVLLAFDGPPLTYQGTHLVFDPKTGEILFHRTDGGSGSIPPASRIWNMGVGFYDDGGMDSGGNTTQGTSALLDFGMFHVSLPPVDISAAVSNASPQAKQAISGYRYRDKIVRLGQSGMVGNILIDGRTKVIGVGSGAGSKLVSHIYLGRDSNEVDLRATTQNPGTGTVVAAEVGDHASMSISTNNICDGDAVYTASLPGTYYETFAANDGVIVANSTSAITFDRYLAGNIEVVGGYYNQMTLNAWKCTIRNATIKTLNLDNVREVVFINCNIVTVINDIDPTNNTYAFVGCSGVAPVAGGAFKLSTGVILQSDLTYTNDFVFGSSTLMAPATLDERRRFAWDDSLANFFAGEDNGTNWANVTGNHNAIFGDDSYINGGGNSNLLSGTQNIIGPASNDNIWGGNDMTSTGAVLGCVICGDTGVIGSAQHSLIVGSNLTLGTLLNGCVITGDTNNIGNNADYSAVFGSNHTVVTNSLNNLIAGLQNSITTTASSYNALVGANMTITGSGGYNAIFGRNHGIVNSSYNLVAGNDNDTASGDQHNAVIGAGWRIGGSSLYNIFVGNGNSAALGSSNSYNAVFGGTHSMDGGNQYNLIAGFQNDINAYTKYNIVTGSAHGIFDDGLNPGPQYNAVFGNNNRVRRQSDYNIIAGRLNYINGYGDYNAVFGYSHEVNYDGTNGSGYNVLAGNNHTLDAYCNYNAIFGSTHTLSRYGSIGAYSNIIAGNSHTIQAGSGYNAVFGLSHSLSSSSGTGPQYNVVGGNGHTLSILVDECAVFGNGNNIGNGTRQSFIAGRQNILTGNNYRIFVGGYSNDVDAVLDSFVFGNNNTVEADYTMTFGYNCVVDATLIGKDPDHTASFCYQAGAIWENGIHLGGADDFGEIGSSQSVDVNLTGSSSVTGAPTAVNGTEIAPRGVTGGSAARLVIPAYFHMHVILEAIGAVDGTAGDCKIVKARYIAYNNGTLTTLVGPVDTYSNVTGGTTMTNCGAVLAVLGGTDDHIYCKVTGGDAGGVTVNWTVHLRAVVSRS